MGPGLLGLGRITEVTGIDFIAHQEVAVRDIKGSGEDCTVCGGTIGIGEGVVCLRGGCGKGGRNSSLICVKAHVMSQHFGKQCDVKKHTNCVLRIILLRDI